jgi:excisionase family DNA binding protein
MSIEIYTVAGAAQYLKLSTKTIICLIAGKKLISSKVNGRDWRIRETDIVDFLDKSFTNQM